MTREAAGATAYALVGAGAAVGALGRWAVELGADAYAGPAALPWAVLAVNVLGALALGALPAVAAVRRSWRLQVLLGPGLLGGFTTVSTFSGHTVALARDGRLVTAAAYVAATVVAGLAAAALGRRLAREEVA